MANSRKEIAPIVLRAAESILRKYVSLAPSIDKVETRLIARRVSESAWQHHEELVLGVLGFHTLAIGTSADPEIGEFEAIVREHQPELVGYIEVDGGLHEICTGERLIRLWLSQLVANRTVEEIGQIDVADFLRSASATFGSRSTRFVVRSPLVGLILPDGVDELQVASGVRIFRLNLVEQSRTMSDDWSKSSPVELHQWIECALEIEFLHTFEFHAEQVAVPSHSLRQQARAVRQVVLDTLHVLAPGHVRSKHSETHLLPGTLPHLGARGREWSFESSRYRPLTLTSNDIPKVVQLFGAIQSAKPPALDRIRRACRRLRFAEGRSDTEDAFLDSMIGAELLLGGPIFKFSLNYAAIAPSEGLKRWEQAHALYSKRNALAHGSHKAEIGETEATAARGLLRDVLLKLLGPEGGEHQTMLSGHNYWQSLFPAGRIDVHGLA
ncbi:MAG: hypothetical protein ABIW82_15585 [Dokdonella sp.]